MLYAPLMLFAKKRDWQTDSLFATSCTKSHVEVAVAHDTGIGGDPRNSSPFREPFSQLVPPSSSSLSCAYQRIGLGHGCDLGRTAHGVT